MQIPWLVLLIGLPGPAWGQELLHAWRGQASGDQFGASVSAAGDVDGDGVPDVIIGAPEADPNGLASGAATVFSGADGSVIHYFTGKFGDRLGAPVAGGGDVDADGFCDLIVGATFDDVVSANSGSVRVYSGRTGALMYLFSGTPEDPFFGNAVANVGDVNNDGFDDVLAAAPFARVGFHESGLVRVYSGLDGSILHERRGQAAGDHLGQSGDGTGDIDGDGCDDFIVGAPGEGQNGGQAHVYSGRTGSIIYTFEDPAPMATLGDAVAGAGDVNGDGVPDVVIGGSRTYEHGSNSGSASVYSGADGSRLYRFLGYNVSGFFGSSVDGAGDVDGDGFADFLVGAPMENQGAVSTTGSVRVFSGRDGHILLDLTGRRQSDNFGIVSGAGDIDGDGRDDILVGARLVDFPPPVSLPTAGEAYLIAVQPPYLYLDLEDGRPTADLRATGLQPDEDTWLFASAEWRGWTWVPGLRVQLHLSGPLAWWGPQRTDAQGEISWSIAIPAKAWETATWLQMAQRGITTNVTGGVPFP